MKFLKETKNPALIKINQNRYIYNITLHTTYLPALIK